MKVYQLLYTKVPPEESPWGKADFHTVFYPLDLLTKQDVFEIEKRIHFPTSEEFKEKETIFYQKIKGEDYLVTLHIRSLPKERDTFGRAGIFLCHGFLFPKELWSKATTPMSIFELVRDRLFTTREDALSSGVDKKTGNIQPLEMPLEKLKGLSDKLPELSLEFEWRMVILLMRIASTTEWKPPLLFEGEQESISSLMNRLLAYVPGDLKPSLGWDPVADGCNLTFYPLKIVGFRNHRPTGGILVKINLKEAKIEETPETAKFLLPYTPYERWLYSCQQDAVFKEDIEGAYKLSLALEMEITPPIKEVLSKRSCFASCNKEVIRDVFLVRSRKILGDIIVSHIASELTIESMLTLIIEDFPREKLVKNVEDVILRNRLTSEAVKIPLFDSFIRTDSPTLSVIKKLWDEEVIRIDDLKNLEKIERFEFIKYLFLTKWAEKEWIPDILKYDEEIFCNLLFSSETGRMIEKILLRIILSKRDFKEIAELILKELLRQEKGFAFLKKEVDGMEILEESLRNGRWIDSQIKKIISWAKKRKPTGQEFPYSQAFLYPKQGIPREIMKDKMTRERLIKCLIQHHGYNTKEIEKLGFNTDELLIIEKQMKDSRWFGKIKELFRLKKETEND